MTEKIYQKSDNIVSRMIAEEVILVPISNNVGDMESIYTLNEVGARIWDLIDGSKKLEEIKDIICREFEVSENQAQADMREFFGAMKEIKAVKEI